MNNKILFGLSCAMLLLSCKVEPDPVEEDTSSSENSTIPYQELPETLRHVQAVNADDDRVIYNPDMGFYSLASVRVDRDGKLYKDSYSAITNKSKPIKDNENFSSKATFDLIHLEVDISDFSALGQKLKNAYDGKTSDFVHSTVLTAYENDTAEYKDYDMPSGKLNCLNEVFKDLQKNNKTVIIRFAYDPLYKGLEKHNGKEDFYDTEPSLDKILNHTIEICRIIKANTNVITAVEMGLFGPWGEMHSTKRAKETVDGITFGNIVKTMKKFNECLGSYNVPVLVRRPEFFYCYLTGTNSSIPETTNTNISKLYRFGMYNDGYLGSSGDSGTFKIGRKNDIAFMDSFTNHTPYGGEMIGNYGISEGKDYEFRNVHLSFLNIAWNTNIFSWADGTSNTYTNGDVKITGTPKINGQRTFQYLLRHMGYRYTVTSSVLSYSDDFSSFNVELKYKNFGFANLPYHRTKVLRLIFKNHDTGEETQIKLSNKFIGAQSATSENGVVSEPEETELCFSAGDISNLEAGDYDVYLKVCDNDTAGSYQIQFANGKNDWNDTLKANKIGSFTKS